jgi:hypothetical protein
MFASKVCPDLSNQNYTKLLYKAELSELSDAPLSGRLLALPANVRLGWKGLPEANMSYGLCVLLVN